MFLTGLVLARFLCRHAAHPRGGDVLRSPDGIEYCSKIYRHPLNRLSSLFSPSPLYIDISWSTFHLPPWHYWNDMDGVVSVIQRFRNVVSLISITRQRCLKVGGKNAGIHRPVQDDGVHNVLFKCVN